MRPPSRYLWLVAALGIWGEHSAMSWTIPNLVISFERLTLPDCSTAEIVGREDLLLGCKKRPQLRGRFYLISVVVAAFDDHRPLAAVPVPAAMPTAVVVTELGACTAKFLTFTELAPITVAADPNANAKVLRAGYGRCRNGNSRERSKRKTKLSHVQSSRSCPRENGGTESLFRQQC